MLERDIDEVDRLARVIWDYHLLHHVPVKSDAILVLGSNDVRVAERASDLFLAGYAPYLIFSGAFGKLTAGVFAKPEAQVFADIALARGVPREKILIEDKSKNTGENIIFTKSLLVERGLDLKSFILIQKPYMERRAYATFKKLWPEAQFVVTSPLLSYEDYPNEIIDKKLLINKMVGDLQRIKIYPGKGFQIAQEIPASVWAAYERLVELGYDEDLVTA